MSGQEYRNLSKALNLLLAETRKCSLGITIKGGKGQKRTESCRNLSKAKCFSWEYPGFRNVNYLSRLQTHSALFGSDPGRRPENKFPLTRVFTDFFPKVLIYFLGEVDEDSALRLFSP